LVENKRKQDSLGMMTPIRVNYFAKSLTGALEPQPLLVNRHLFNGFQFSLFFNESLKTSELNTNWNEEYTVCNESNTLEILIAGNSQEGIIDYIKRFGFYEGGSVANSHRIEPAILHAILTGRCSAEVFLLVEQKGSLTVKQSNLEISACEQRLQLLSQQLQVNADRKLIDEVDWLKERQKLLEGLIKKQKLETQKLLDYLKNCQ